MDSFYYFQFLRSKLPGLDYLELHVGSFRYPANIYLFKLNNRHARAM